DFNKDGKLDLAVTYIVGSQVGILLGNGDGTFQTPVLYSVGNNPHVIVKADLNNDGNVDLITANQTGNTLSVLLGKSDGTFQSANTVHQPIDSPIAVAVGDFNEDGSPDLVAGYYNFFNLSATVFLNNGDGTFQTPQSYTAGLGALGVAVGDFNADGGPDLAV